MRHRFIGNSYNRESMVEICGEETIKKLERENCEMTGRVMDDDEEEFVASLRVKDVDGNPITISAYYYQPSDVLKETEDLGNLDWEIDDYGID